MATTTPVLEPAPTPSTGPIRRCSSWSATSACRPSAHPSPTSRGASSSTGVAVLEASAAVESVSIGHPDFREHVVRGSDFFAADEHPRISFRLDPDRLRGGRDAVLTGCSRFAVSNWPVAPSARSRRRRGSVRRRSGWAWRWRRGGRSAQLGLDWQQPLPFRRRRRRLGRRVRRTASSSREAPDAPARDQRPASAPVDNGALLDAARRKRGPDGVRLLEPGSTEIPAYNEERRGRSRDGRASSGTDRPGGRRPLRDSRVQRLRAGRARERPRLGLATVRAEPAARTSTSP